MEINIFDGATSELSQDALIIWLLKWADHSQKSVNEALNQAGKLFLDRLFEQCGHKSLENYTVDVRKQEHNIDVLCLINEKYVLIIEDKTKTSNHSDQLSKYYQYVQKKYTDHLILPIYFKSHDQSHYNNLQALNLEGDTVHYIPFLREDILSVLKSGIEDFSVKNDIFYDYYAYLQKIDDDIQSFLSKPWTAWSSNAWKGFFMHLQKNGRLKGDWSYVPNPSGGFMGYWWAIPNSPHDAYLQIESSWNANLKYYEPRLCIKLHVKKKEDQVSKRSNVYKQTMEMGKIKGILTSKPKKFRKGAHMTVAIFNGEFLQYDSLSMVNFDKTMECLTDYSKIFIK